MEDALGLGNLNFNELCYTTSSMFMIKKGTNIICNSIMLKLGTILQTLSMGLKSQTMWLSSTIKGPIMKTRVAWLFCLVQSSQLLSMKDKVNVLQGHWGLASTNDLIVFSSREIQGIYIHTLFIVLLINFCLSLGLINVQVGELKIEGFKER